MFDLESLKFWRKVSKDESAIIREYAHKEMLDLRRIWG